MPRDRQHFILSGLGKIQAFKAKGGGGSKKRPSDVANRVGHAQALLQALDALPNLTTEGRPGVYLDVQGRPGEVMVTGSLNVSDLTLLKADPARPDENYPGQATVFATAKGLQNLRSKIDQFAEKNRSAEDGEEGRPYNADLVQSIGAIVEAGLRALWRSPNRVFPEGAGPVAWEIWLDKSHAAPYSTRYRKAKARKGLTGSFGDRSWLRKAII